MLELCEAGFCLSEERGHWLLAPTSLSFETGAFWGVVGPNGSGKSTMLRLLSGEWKPSQGEVRLDGHPLHLFSARALARRRAVLSQKSALRFPFSVEEVVSFGQFSLEGQEAALGRSMTPKEAMQATNVDSFAERLYPTLSGGESCRVDFARVLAQQTPILLLDEPTNHLDPRFQVSVLTLCRKLADAGALVIAALHDLNFAARSCDRLIMLKAGQIQAEGTPYEVLQPERLRQVYDIPFEVGLDTKQQPYILPIY